MKSVLFAFTMALFPFISFAQNGSVSFGVVDGTHVKDTVENAGAHPSPGSTSTITSMSMESEVPANVPQHADCKKPMSSAGFKSAREVVIKAGYEDNKLAAAKEMIATNCVSTDQVMQICKLFGFEQAKLDFAKLAYAKTTDPINYAKVKTVLTFASSKTALDEFLKKGGK